MEDDFFCRRSQRDLLVHLGKWDCFFGLGEIVDGVVLESCEGVNLDLDDVRRCSRVDVFLLEEVPSPS